MIGDLLSDYDFALPPELIAQTPLEDRAASRLLVLHRGSGRIEHRAFRDAPEYLAPGDVLVMNDTKVDARRIRGVRPTGGVVEALLVESIAPGVYDALVKPAKRLRPGSTFLAEDRFSVMVTEGASEPYRRLVFQDAPDLSGVGEVPLPPYITARLAEETRYDTVYAAHPGSAAAPTAGLHFTREILGELGQKGVKEARVTLHVGIDTFRPVDAERLDDHRMHGELCQISELAARAINARSRRLVAVGTTSVRTIESFADERGEVRSDRHRSSLFIRPGYEFRAVDAMFTNFHLPKTTMLAMISALAGIEAVREAYRQAIAERYQFLSFGDSMLII